VFQEHLLPRGLWDVAGERVDPSKITDSALLTIEGELDDISGSGQTRAAHKLCTGIPQADQQHYTVPGAGHYGIFSGRRWRTQVYPQVREFIAAHDRKAAPAAQAAKQALPAGKPAVKKPAAKRVAAAKKAAMPKKQRVAKNAVR
jgi:poly(3-hydroxybutyrate) depolymerase